MRSRLRKKSRTKYRLLCRRILLSTGYTLLLLPIFPLGAEARQPVSIPNKIQLKAYPFDLAKVRLLSGPFKQAMELNGQYLLRLDPDRLLSWFRKEAGLKPKGDVYGGWESMGVAGHSLGHYLSACAMMFASSGDTRFRDRVKYIVDELELCQNANGNGYVAAIPNGKKIFQEVAAGEIRSKGFDLNGGWVPWYTLHKLFAGLLDADHYCANKKALEVAVKLANWADVTTAKLSDEQFQLMLSCEHGGMNESMAELYARTGDEKYLRLSRRFHHRAVLDPLVRQEDRLQGLHANTQIPKLIGLARRYELSGDTADKAAAEFFWNRVVHHHSYVIGGNSLNEHFGSPDKLNSRLGQNTCETCNTYNMLKLTEHLFTWHPSAEYADYYERALYNHILASQNPTDGMVCYYVPLRPGAHKVYSTSFDSFWCCVGTGMENHTKYGNAIYFHDADGLWVNLFVASELNWAEKGLTLRQQTSYPESDAVTFTFKLKKPTNLALRLRYPRWSDKGIIISVKGSPVAAQGNPGSFLEIRRTWKNGDTLKVSIPMSLKLEAMPDNANRVSFLFGPTVLSGDLGPEGDATSKELTSVPVLIAESSKVESWLKPVAGQPLTFHTISVGRPRDLTIYPFYRMHGKRYSVYFDLLTKEQWKQREAEIQTELELARKLEGVTVDFVQPGEMQPERDHNMQGENTIVGEHEGRKWRHANDGGWFSFDLKALPDKSLSLLCTFWGGEVGPRTFDILVDGTKIASQALNNDKPGEFFDLTYPIAESLTKNKQKVTVRFQPHPGNTAGGLYGLRIIRN